MSLTLQQQQQFIKAQRAKGVPDAQIVARLDQLTTSAPKRSIIGNILPAAFGVGGAILGGIGGAAVAGIPTLGIGAPAGAAAGGIAGGAAGGALGETVQQAIEKRTGLRQSYDTPQIVASGAISGATEGVGRAAGAALQIGADALQPVMARFISKASGYPTEVVAEALKRTPGAVATAKNGEAALNDIITKTATGIHKLAKDTLTESQDEIARLSRLSGGGKGEPGTRQDILKQGRNFVGNIAKTLRSDYNIGVQKGGTLLFNRAANASRIVSGGEQKAIQDAFDTVQSIKNDTTIHNIDAVVERLLVLQRKTPAGTPTGPETKAIIRDMTSEVISFVRSVGDKVAPAYSEYANFLEGNIPKRVLISDAKELFGSSSNMSGAEVSKTAKRLLQLFNDGNLAIRESVGKVGNAVEQDVVGGAAGTLINKGGVQTSVRAQNLTARSVAARVVEAIPRAVVNTYIKTGKLATLENHPILAAIAKTIGVSAKALAQEVAQSLADKKTR